MYWIYSFIKETFSTSYGEFIKKIPTQIKWLYYMYTDIIFHTLQLIMIIIPIVGIEG